MQLLLTLMINLPLRAYSGFRLNRPHMLAGEGSRTVGDQRIPRLRNRVSRFIPGRSRSVPEAYRCYIAYKKPGNSKRKFCTVCASPLRIFVVY
jgi:hypothetical protein